MVPAETTGDGLSWYHDMCSLVGHDHTSLRDSQSGPECGMGSALVMRQQVPHTPGHSVSPGEMG